MIIRPIAPADAPALSRLVAQLGYPAPAEVLPERLEKLSASAGDGDSMAVVAEDPNGAQKISLASGVHRLDTHKYYDNRGYERSGIRFTKRLERQ